MRRLDKVHDPRDLRALPPAELPGLAEEIRTFLVDRVSRTGGHLGPNLGVVELTIALHRVFESPRDVLLWDTGHQSYVHKIITGRAADFTGLRQEGGLSGYPSRAESVHDWIENSHASTALSYADGIAKAWRLSGEESDRRVVAVIGDGALTGGMAWEALNNIAASDRRVVIVVNDNERSYSPTIGGLANHLATLRTTRGYESFLRGVRRLLGGTPVVGQPVFDALHGVKRGVKDIVAPQGMFEDLGLKYLGPVDGHDIAAVEHVLHRARDYPRPVIVHVITEKGHGYAPAENDEADRFHGIGVIDPETGQSLAPTGRSWTSVFSDELLALGRADDRVVALTAAMLGPTGLAPFQKAYPHRTFDVGIAEQHAITSATGMALAGLRPVVALYATFLNRAFDQVLMDAALHSAPVTVVLDRAGVTGDDGASHNGVWDLSILQVVPGLRIAAPRDPATVRQALRDCLAHEGGPSVVRFPKGQIGPDVPVAERRGGVDLLRVTDGDPDVVVVAVGAMAAVGLDVADRLADQGITAAVAAPLWVTPVSEDLLDVVAPTGVVAVIEDGSRVGGVGARIALAMSDRGLDQPVRIFGVAPHFLAHAPRARILAAEGLAPADIARALVETVSAAPAAAPAPAPAPAAAPAPAPAPASLCEP